MIVTTADITVYADDTDAHVTVTITDRDGADVDFPATLSVDGGAYVVAGEWLDVAATTRQARVPIPTGLTAGPHTLYLQVPGGTDLRVGTFYVAART